MAISFGAITSHPKRERDRIAGIWASTGKAGLNGVFTVPQHSMARLNGIRRDPFGRSAGAGERDHFLIVVVVRIGIQGEFGRQLRKAEGPGGDSLGSRYVPLGEQGRDAENVADVVEAITGVVHRKFFG
jgi:hypothetical protein